MFKIEKGVPLPPAHEQYKDHGKRLYPWHEMEVMDSIFIPCEAAYTGRVDRTVQEANRRMKKQFTTRRVSGGTRMWRIS